MSRLCRLLQRRTGRPGGWKEKKVPEESLLNYEDDLWPFPSVPPCGQDAGLLRGVFVITTGRLTFHVAILQRLCFLDRSVETLEHAGFPVRPKTRGGGEVENVLGGEVFTILLFCVPGTDSGPTRARGGPCPDADPPAANVPSLHRALPSAPRGSNNAGGGPERADSDMGLQAL